MIIKNIYLDIIIENIRMGETFIVLKMQFTFCINNIFL